MKIQSHKINDIEIAEIVSEEIIIKNTEDALDLIGNIYYQGFDKMIIHQKNLTENFFDLKNKLAGDILQKFSTYRIRLCIVVDFSKLTTKSLKNFIYESNKGKQINFLSSVDEAIKHLTK